MDWTYDGFLISEQRKFVGELCNFFGCRLDCLKTTIVAAFNAFADEICGTYSYYTNRNLTR